MSYKLSILIPSYEYVKGVSRILNTVCELSEEIEIIIFDDSHSDDVENEVQSFSRGINRITYKKNIPSLGAAANWNALLDAAQGEYCVLMHHDETPLNRAYISDVLNELSCNPDVDVFLCDVFLADENLHIMRRHLPNLFRWLVVNKFPLYLMRRNVIGPSAALIVKTNVYPRFNNKLHWLIDVELYKRLCLGNLNWRLSQHIKIVSVQRQSGTITSTLMGNIKEIDSNERQLLQSNTSSQSDSLKKYRNLIFNVVESFFWTIFRVIQYTISIKSLIKNFLKKY